MTESLPASPPSSTTAGMELLDRLDSPLWRFCAVCHGSGFDKDGLSCSNGCMPRSSTTELTERLDRLNRATLALTDWASADSDVREVKPLMDEKKAARSAVEDLFRERETEIRNLTDACTGYRDSLERLRSTALIDAADAARWRFVAPLLADQLYADGEMMLKVGIHDFHTGSVGDYSDKLVRAAIDTARATDAARLSALAAQRGDKGK